MTEAQRQKDRHQREIESLQEQIKSKDLDKINKEEEER